MGVSFHRRLDASTLAFGGVCALLLAMPFERLNPVLRLPWQQISDLELVIAAAIGAWIAGSLIRRHAPLVGTPITIPVAGLLLALTVSAVLAPGHTSNAVKTMARLFMAAMVALLTLNGITTSARLRTAVTFMVTSAVIVGICAIGETMRWPSMLVFLNQFRDGVRVVGGQVRASATLQYPTIASVYFEMAFAIALGLLVSCADRRAWKAVVAAFAAIAVIAAGVSLTFTRAGLVTMTCSLLVVGGWRIWRHGADRGLAILAASAALVAAVVSLSWSHEAILLRFTSENRQNWYRAAFSHPARIDFSAGEVRQIEVGVTNAGRMTWQGEPDAPFFASYHWIDAATTRVIDYDGLRTPFPRPLAPGDSVSLLMDVQAPVVAGDYRVIWDVVQEQRLWFTTEPGARLAVARATVSGSTTRPAPRHRRPGPINLPEPVETIGRGTLWRGALRIIGAYPLLGIGLDNYRLTYGPYVGLAHADSRVHSNNLYLEILTGGGLVSGLFLAWTLWRLCESTLRTAFRTTDEMDGLYSGVAAAGAAVLVHGLVDSFLTFTPTYLAMAMTLGFALAPARESFRAHRI